MKPGERFVGEDQESEGVQRRVIRWGATGFDTHVVGKRLSEEWQEVLCPRA